MTEAGEIQVMALDDGPALAVIQEGGSAHAVIWPGVGAQLRSMHRIELGSGGRTIELRHPAEGVYYVVQGDGVALDADVGQEQALRAGAMIHIDPGTTYVIRANASGMSLVGGPSPPDPALYEDPA